MGNPQRSSTPESPTQKRDGKMTGSYQLPFSFPFPARIDPDSYSTADNTVPPSPLAATPFSPLAPPPSPYGKEKHSRAFESDPIPLQTTSPLRSKFGNLLGKHRSVPSQPKASSTLGSQDRVFDATPASFARRDVSARVQYELLVRIVHGRFRPDSR